MRSVTFAASDVVPRFVVMTTTPFAARAPYIDDDEASLSTDTDSMSDGEIALKSELEIGTPSRMNSGAVPELMELVPRIWNVAAFEGSPELDHTIRPGL